MQNVPPQAEKMYQNFKVVKQHEGGSHVPPTVLVKNHQVLNDSLLKDSLEQMNSESPKYDPNFDKPYQ